MKKLFLLLAVSLASLTSFSQRNVVTKIVPIKGSKFEMAYVQTYNIFPIGTHEEKKAEEKFRHEMVRKYHKMGYMYDKMKRFERDSVMGSNLYMVFVKAL